MGVARIVLLALALPSAATASMADLLRAPPKSRESVKRTIRCITVTAHNRSATVCTAAYARRPRTARTCRCM